METSHAVDVEEEHPLKQGLKHKLSLNNLTNIFFVEEEHPLKQGLKQK